LAEFRRATDELKDEFRKVEADLDEPPPPAEPLPTDPLPTQPAETPQTDAIPNAEKK